MLAAFALGGAGASALAAPAVVQPMRMRKLGGSDILVSECCLGGMTWGDQNSAQEAMSQLDLAWDFGVNFLDTAEGYPVPMNPETQGNTDRAIQKWMAETKRPRDSVVISSKVCGYNERYTWFRESGEGTRLTKSQIHESVDASLRRLGTDHIDLLQFHWPDRAVGLTSRGGGSIVERALGVESFASQVEAMSELMEAGKIRTWGLSNENTEGLGEFLAAADAVGVAPPVCVQNAYSLLQRGDETDLISMMGLADGDAGGGAKAEDGPIGYIPYSPLSGGVLSGKYATRKRQPKRSRLSLMKGYEESFRASSGPKAVDLYVQVARKHGVTPTQLAIALCNSRSFVTSTIVGATTMPQLAEDLQGFAVEWTQDMEDDINAVFGMFPNPWRVQQAGMG